MRALRSLATIGFVFAVLGSATSPSFAGPKAGPPPSGWSGTREEWDKLVEDYKVWKKNVSIQRRGEVLNASKQGGNINALKRLNALGGGPVNVQKGVIGIASKGMQTKGAPQRPPTGGSDWITPKTKAATTPTQSLYKPVSSLGVKPSVPAQPQTLYKPVNSLGVKPSVPSAPPPPKR